MRHPHPTRRTVIATIGIAMLSLLLAACGSTDTTKSSASKDAAAPKLTRIISLSPTATESLFAIGAGKQVIAVDDQSNYPAEAPRTKLSGFTPNVEAIAADKPQLVVISYDPGGLVDGLKKLDIDVLMQPSATSLNDAYDQIEKLGTVTGHAKQSDNVVAGMKDEFAKLASNMPTGSKLSVYHELSPDGYSSTSDSFVGEIYTSLGLKNIADSAKVAAGASPQLSAEFVASSNPDLIVLADTSCCDQTAKTVAARPGWSQIGAVRHHAVIEVNDDIASRWGPRLVDFARAVATGAAAATPTRAA